MRDHRGFTLIEILVSLAIFAVIIIGALGVLGAAEAGGFLEGFPTGFLTARVARDYTAASVYLQAFNEFVASKGSAGAPVGTSVYCIGSGCSPATTVSGCGKTVTSVAAPLPSPWLDGYPAPPGGQGYQLDWTRLDVLIQTWYWDNATKKFTTAVTTDETLTCVQSKLTWQVRGTPRTLTVERYIP